MFWAKIRPSSKKPGSIPHLKIDNGRRLFVNCLNSSFPKIAIRLDFQPVGNGLIPAL